MFDKLIKELEALSKGETLQIPVEPDAEGYLDRECPAPACEFLFKVHLDDWSSHVRDAEAFCPMCRHASPKDTWLTKAQVEAAQNYGKAVIAGRINRAMRADARAHNARQRPGAFLRMTMDVKGPPDPALIPIQSGEPMRLRATCEHCGCRYSFIGSAFFCPACGHNSASQTFLQTLENARRAAGIRQELLKLLPPDDAENSSRDLREKAVSDIVTSVQRLAERVWDAMPGTTPPVRNLFQRMDDASTAWRAQTGKGFDDLISPADFSRLKFHYQRRHLLAHCQGIVDADYIRKSGDTSVAVGQRIVVDEASVREFADLAEALGRGILASLPGGAPLPVAPPSPAPAVVAPTRPRNRRGLTLHAEAVARHLVERSELGRATNPVIAADDLRQATGLPDGDLASAARELEEAGLIRRHQALGMGSLGFIRVSPEHGLFEVFDPVFGIGDPAADARIVAKALLDTSDGGAVSEQLATSLGWTPRRMNPALSVLIARDLVLESKSLHPTWVSHWVRAKPGIDRFATS